MYKVQKIKSMIPGEKCLYSEKKKQKEIPKFVKNI